MKTIKYNNKEIEIISRHSKEDFIESLNKNKFQIKGEKVYKSNGIVVGLLK